MKKPVGRVLDKDGAGPQNTSARQIGRIAATLLTAAMIIGTGIFGALGATAAHAGSTLLIAMIPGALVAWSTGVSGAQLGVNFPKAGGAFVWARAFRYDSLAFIAGCCYLGQGIVGTSVVALAFAYYSAQAVPGLPIHISAAAIVLVAVALNSFGISFTSRVVIGLMALIVALLFVFVGFSLPHVEVSNLSPRFETGPLEFMGGAAIFFWAWDGFMRTAIMAGEMRDPRRTIPFSIAGGIAIAAIVFYAVAAVTLGVLGGAELGKDDVPLFKAATRAVGSWGGWVILAAAWLASINELISDLLSASRVGLAMGEAHEMPHWLGEQHPRFNVPRHAVLAIGAVTFVLVLFFDLRQILPLASFYLLVWFAITHFAALQLSREQRLTSPFFSWFGLFGCLVLVFFIPPMLLAIGAASLSALFGIRWIIRRRAAQSG
ncbi:APC family permease [Mesorhizobium sp. VK24D]|uniref:APC family permease n=1 Tax=Mesorhizobium album TaxID=3072314 RepID=A0ABU4YBC3_9HYPH|nr:APC family permease [Mesorhizobium sp. VK24D]MDX8483187.1 APC family permease [Mesorhizobium sp. VK24D]